MDTRERRALLAQFNGAVIDNIDDHGDALTVILKDGRTLVIEDSEGYGTDLSIYSGTLGGS